MTTKYETPQYRHGVFFDEVRETAPTGERKQVYLLQNKVVAIGLYQKYSERGQSFVDGGITMSVRGGRTKDIQKALATDKDYKSLTTEEVHKTGVPMFTATGDTVVDIHEVLDMEHYFLSFNGVTPITEADRVEINIRLTQAAKFLEKDHKELSDWLRYVSRNAIALANKEK